jgi:hypothetical protein
VTSSKFLIKNFRVRARDRVRVRVRFRVRVRKLVLSI